MCPGIALVGLIWPVAMSLSQYDCWSQACAIFWLQQFATGYIPACDACLCVLPALCQHALHPQLTASLLTMAARVCRPRHFRCVHGPPACSHLPQGRAAAAVADLGIVLQRLAAPASHAAAWRFDLQTGNFSVLGETANRSMFTMSPMQSPTRGSYLTHGKSNCAAHREVPRLCIACTCSCCMPPCCRCSA